MCEGSGSACVCGGASACVRAVDLCVWGGGSACVRQWICVCGGEVGMCEGSGSVCVWGGEVGMCEGSGSACVVECCICCITV